MRRDPSLIEQVAQLRAAGWRMIPQTNTWQSPKGARFTGTREAWKAMKRLARCTSCR